MQMKPTQKLIESKKRLHDNLDDNDLLANSLPIKIKLKKTGQMPTLIFKLKGRVHAYISAW